MEKTSERVSAVRLIVITSVIVALVISVLSFYFPSYPYYTLAVFLIVVIIVIFISVNLSDMKTTRSREIHAMFVYDGATGEITDYPNHIVQDIIRQAIKAVSEHDATLISRIINPPELANPLSKERGVFIDLAELVLLRQVSLVLALLPEAYERYFVRISQLPLGFMDNSIVKPLVTTLRDERKVRMSAINNLDSFEIPKGSRFEVSRNPRYAVPTYRQLVLSNRYARIKVEYSVSGLMPVSSMNAGVPAPEIGHMPINPYFEEDAFKRFTAHGLRIATFHYHVRAELLHSKLYLFLMVLGIRPWSTSIRTFLSFIDYFVNNLDKSPFGSIDTERFAEQERNYWEHKFIVETLQQLKQFLDNPGEKSSASS